MLSLWQQAVERGESASTEALCRDCPELREELERRVGVLKRLGNFAKHVSNDTTVAGPAPLVEPPITLPDLPGYDVIGQLGEGGMGFVFKARDRRLERTVAVKMLKANALDAVQYQHFLAEAKAVARLNHPHIVQLFAFGEHAGHPYLAMELVSGPTLQACTQGEVQPPADAARLVMLLARAMQAAHDQGIVHRDLKPANVLLAPPLSDPALNSALGCPKLTDFGLALRLGGDDDRERMGTVAGTPSYMAPEQATGQVNAIGPATDVYGLGAILYQLLTGRPPFRGVSIAATLRQVTNDDPVPPRLLQPDAPRDLETICLKCLQKDSTRRYTSARSLADDLHRFLSGEPIVARPVGPIERAWKWACRKPAIATLLASLGFATLFAFAALAYGWRQAEHVATLQAGRADYERKEREKTEEQLYLNQIALSHRDLIDGKPTWAESTLQQTPARLRRWEWFHLMTRCRTLDAVSVRTHDGKVSSVTASPDGLLFASADSEGTIHIGEARTHSVWTQVAAGVAGMIGGVDTFAVAVSLFPNRVELPVRVLLGHAGSVNWLAFTPAGKLVSGGEDGTIATWDPATGKQISRFEEHDGAISCFAIHPTLPRIASATFIGSQIGHIFIWDHDTNKVIQRLQGHSNRITGLAFHPNGESIVSASHDRTLIVWNVANGERIRTLNDHRFPVACVAFSPDGRMLASAAGRLKSRGPEDSEILVWDSATGHMRHRLQGHADRAVALAFTPDGERLATAGWDRRIFLWNPATGQEVLSMSGHQDGVLSVTFTKLGQMLSGSYDGTMRIWELTEPRTQRSGVSGELTK